MVNLVHELLMSHVQFLSDTHELLMPHFQYLSDTHDLLILHVQYLLDIHDLLTSQTVKFPNRLSVCMLNMKLSASLWS